MRRKEHGRRATCEGPRVKGHGLRAGPRAYGQGPRAEGHVRRATGEGPHAKGQGPRATGQGLYVKDRWPLGPWLCVSYCLCPEVGLFVPACRQHS